MEHESSNEAAIEKLTYTPSESGAEGSLRPQSLSEFIGHRELVSRLGIYIESVRLRNSILDHVLFSGPPGLGKTSLAKILANEMQRPFKSVQAPVLEKTGDLAAHLTNLEEGDVFFIDEIHRLRRNLEEVLYGAMEDYRIDIVIGQGTGAQTIPLDLPRFTLVGATTRPGLLTAPLLTRFGIQEKLEYYEEGDLTQIAQRTAQINHWNLSPEAAQFVAFRCRGTPRILNQLLNRIHDFAVVQNQGNMDLGITQKTLESLGIDASGLTRNDRDLIVTLIEKYQGGPVGLDTLAATLSEDIDNLTDIYEPYLMRLGLISRTPRGRVATAHAYRFLGRPVPGNLSIDQWDLFGESS